MHLPVAHSFLSSRWSSLVQVVPGRALKGLLSPGLVTFPLTDFPLPRLWTTMLSNSYWGEALSQGHPQAMSDSCSHLASRSAALSASVLSASYGLSLNLPIFPGCMERQSQDTSLVRKDAWTQTSPARRRIRPTQVQGAGKSVYHWAGAREAGLSLLRAVLNEWVWRRRRKGFTVRQDPNDPLAFA